MMICCPMTSRIKGYPFEVLFKGEAPPGALAEVQAKIRALIGL